MENNSQNLINNLNTKTQHVIKEFISQDEGTTKIEEKINLEETEETLEESPKKIYKKKFFKKYNPRINREIDNSQLIEQLQKEILCTLKSKINNIKKKLEKENFRNLEQEKKLCFYCVYLNMRRKNKIYNKDYGLTMYNLNNKLYVLNYKTSFYKEYIKDCTAKIKNLLNLLKKFEIKLFGPGSAYNEKVNIENLIKNVEENITQLKNNLNILEKDLQTLIYNINSII